MRFLLLGLVLCFVSAASANEYGIPLAPGEVLISVNGVPVCNSVAVIVNRPIARATIAPIRAVHNAVRAVTGPVSVYPMQRQMRCVNGNCR